MSYSISPDNSNISVIVLSKGYVTILDTEDAIKLGQFHWYVLKSKDNKWYAVRENEDSISFLHREILNAPANMLVDHKNGDSLNNCKQNLRLCTSSQNAANREGSRFGSSIYKGVHKKKNKWYARYKNKHIGSFDVEEDAARAYDKVHLDNDKEFARLNFPIN